MHWSTWVETAASLVAIAGGFGAVAKLLTGRLAKQVEHICTEIVSDIKTDVAVLQARFDAETGGNSNGLRQKVNEVAADVAKVVGVVETLTKVAK